jgi:Serine carboxypeptidase
MIDFSWGSDCGMEAKSAMSINYKIDFLSFRPLMFLNANTIWTPPCTIKIMPTIICSLKTEQLTNEISRSSRHNQFPHSGGFTWKISSVLLVDSPVGAGYSYAENEEDYVSTDSTTVADLYDFLNKVRIQTSITIPKWPLANLYKYILAFI